jgi:transposase-like protein
MSQRRDAQAARRFFEQALGTTKVNPTEVVTDRAGTSRSYWTSCSQPRGTAPSSTPTTTSKPIMAD